MAETVKERLIEFLEYKKINQRRFEMSIGASNGFVKNLKKTISAEKAYNISETYPELNIEWLQFGKGNMIVEDRNNSNGNQFEGSAGGDVTQISGGVHTTTAKAETENLLREIIEQKDTISTLKETIHKLKMLAFSAKLCPTKEMIDNILDEMITQKTE